MAKQAIGIGVAMVMLVGHSAPARAADGEPQVGPRAAIVAPESGLRGFSLTLVQGDMKAGTSADNLPAAAARALADMKDFLPYRSYTLLDTAWTLGTGTIKMQLRQSDTQIFDVELRAGLLPQFMIGDRTPGGALVNVLGFRMQRPGGANSTERRDVEQAQRAEAQSASILERQLADAQRTSGDASRQTADALRAKLLETRGRLERLQTALDDLGSRDALIDTSFRMKLNETVVVGTSRQQGDKALIVLVTAVGK